MGWKTALRVPRLQRSSRTSSSNERSSPTSAPVRPTSSKKHTCSVGFSPSARSIPLQRCSTSRWISWRVRLSASANGSSARTTFSSSVPTRLAWCSGLRASHSATARSYSRSCSGAGSRISSSCISTRCAMYRSKSLRPVLLCRTSSSSNSPMVHSPPALAKCWRTASIAGWRGKRTSSSSSGMYRSSPCSTRGSAR